MHEKQISHSEVDEKTADECEKVPKLRNEPNHKKYLKISKYTRFEDAYMNTLRIISFRTSQYLLWKYCNFCFGGQASQKQCFNQ
jgi:hypothetical protein